MNILDLFAHIGLKADTGAADNFLKSVNGIKSSLKGAIAGTLSLSAAVAALNVSMRESNAMNKFAADTGASVEEMQRWRAVADQVSGAGETVAASIRAITQNQEKIKLGQGNISGYQLLGIDPRSDPFKVLEALRTKTQGMSQGMRRNIAAQFGVSNDLVQTLELTNAQFDAMAKKAWVVPKESIDRVNRVRAEITQLTQRLNYMRMEAIAKLAPYIEKGIVWLGKLIDFGERLVRMIDQIVRATIGWKNVLIGIAIAIGAAVLATSPLTLGLIALLLILDDLYVYSKGGKSLFGELVKQFPLLGEIFSGVYESLRLIAETLKGIFQGDWSGFDQMVARWGTFGEILKGIKDTLVFMMGTLKFESLEGSFGGFAKDVDEGGFGAAMKRQVELFTGELRAIGSFFGLDSESDTATPAPIPAIEGPAGGIPLSLPEPKKQDLFPAFPGGMRDFYTPRAPVVPSNTSITVSPTIEINGATDPIATGNEVERRMNEAYKNARTNTTGSKKER